MSGPWVLFLVLRCFLYVNVQVFIDTYNVAHVEKAVFTVLLLLFLSGLS